MPSIVDMIAQTEESAERIKNEAQAKAKSLVNRAKDEAEESIREAREDARRELLLRRENARHMGEKLAQEIKESREAESASNANEAKKHLDKAVKFIIERLSV